MIFDLTNEIVLDKKSARTYKKIQFGLYVLAIFTSCVLVYMILFPTAIFTFSFLNPNSTQNSIISPRKDDNSFLERGVFPVESKSFFDTALVGDYSKSKISVTLSKKSEPLEKAGLNVRKSYQAFFYPEGVPIGFKNGTLLRHGNDFYIVSVGKLKKFADRETVLALGFFEKSFQETTDNDLKANPEDSAIVSRNDYPDGTIFKVADNYFILTGQKLKKFVSQNTYLSQYPPEQAISKSEDFLKNYPPDNEPLGFADGTLISYGISVYIISGKNVWPINNTVTFESMGYDWSDLVSASGDEFSLYEKTPLFTLASPHPNGTIFITSQGSKYYMVKNGQKCPFLNTLAAKSWSRKNPVLVSEKSFDVSEACQLKKDFLSFRTYSCEIPTDKFNELVGKDYEFEFSGENEIKADSLKVTFKKTVTFKNLKAAISELISKIKGNYAIQN